MNPHLGTQASNQEPYCSELYNHLNEPLSFQAKTLPGFEDGFSVWVDVQNTHSSASELLKYLQGAEFLDTMSKELIAVVNSFNPVLKVLAQSFVRFSWERSGIVQVRFSVDTIRERFYDSAADFLRLALEVCTFFSFVWGIIAALCQVKKLAAIDVWPLVLNLSMVFALGFWWIHTAVHTRQMDMNTSYSVYSNIFSPAYKFKLADISGTGLRMATESTFQVCCTRIMVAVRI